MTDGWERIGWSGADGLALAGWVLAGAGPGTGKLPVLCLHGLTRNARDFATFGRWLAGRGHSVIAADMRGRGNSAWDPARRYTLPVYADDVARLLDAHRLDRVVVVGTSMGGLIAGQLALAHPDRFAGTVVNDVGPVIEERGLSRIAAYVGAAPEIADWDAAAAYVRWQNEAALPHFTPADWAGMARALMAERDGRIRPDYDPAIAQPADVGPRDPWAEWQALLAAAPVLLLRGERSDILSAATAEAMVAGQPDARLVEIPLVGHAPTLDEPQARAAIADFLVALG